MYLRNLKIGIRATAIFAALALLVLILGLTSLNRMHTMDSPPTRYALRGFQPSCSWMK